MTLDREISLRLATALLGSCILVWCAGSWVISERPPRTAVVRSAPAPTLEPVWLFAPLVAPVLSAIAGQTQD